MKVDEKYQPNLLSISDLAGNLHEELLFNGDSLTYEDVEKSIIDHARLHNGWQHLADANKQLLTDGEWAILYPVVRTHLDYVQAKRMEGSRAINGEAFGKDVNSAYQDYKLELDEMPKKAFNEQPFWL